MNDQDKGHENLIRDLEDLLVEAKAFEFHDFKAELHNRLSLLAERVVEGLYDN